MGEALTVLSIIMIVVGVIMTILGIILLIIDQGEIIPWYVWFTLVLGITIGTIGAIILVIIISHKNKPDILV